ncbi:MAG: ExeM/NucH family extracellular endonuclease [Spirulina sp.]
MATQLTPGDLAIIGMNADNPDLFAFVLLTDITIGTEIFFTDNGVFSNGSFRQTEGILKYVASADLAAGTVIEFTGVGGDFTVESNGFALSTSGDQIVAYQGTVNNPTFIYALNNESSGWQSDATSSNTSALPTGLTEGTSAIALNEIDNAVYTGTTTGTKAELLAAISNTANWSGSNSTRQTLPSGSFTVTDSGGGSGSVTVFINEIHYDNAGSDVNEGVEIAGTAGTDLAGWTLEFYNGNGGSLYATLNLSGTLTIPSILGGRSQTSLYATLNLSGTLTDQDNGFGTQFFARAGIQNGSPDGIALIDNNGNVVQFLSYEGSFTAVGGTADGLTSSDIGVSESGSTPVGFSLQLTGTGSAYEDFTWAAAASNTYNAVNTNQSFGGSGGGGNDISLISAIQGSGASSPLAGQTVTIEAVVVGDFQDGSSGTNGDLDGFFVQEEDSDADADPTTSEGLFVFDGSTPAVDVNIGDVVRVTGTVAEFNGLTELINVTVAIQGTDSLPTAATVNFPVTAVGDLEAFEGMQVTIPEQLFVTEYFNLDRFGEVVLSANDPNTNAPDTDGRLDQYPQFNAPDVAGFAAYQDAIAKRRIILDDGQTVQNPNPIIHGRGGNPLSATNPLRGGDTVTNLSGILSFDFGDYRIQPVAGVDFQATNPRPATPEDVGGNLQVVSLNVLNFFTTLDVTGNPGSGPNNLSPRGADSQAEFDRQLEKLVTTLETLDADIVGLIEIENEFGGDQNGDGQYAIDTLVTALNNKVGAGTYAFVDPGRTFVDTGDAISVGAIYKTSTVQLAPDTTVEILDDSVLPGLGLNFGNAVFDGDRSNRASLAATFEEIASGERLTVAVNHFKSKGSVNSAPGNADAGDGAGNNNAIRLQASQALNAWLNSDPTGSGDTDFLIIGDLNAYAKEDPIAYLESQGYTNVVSNPESAYSFVFDGQFGTLDYGLASTSLISQVTGATEWHVNADEPDALDYNLDFGRDPTLFDGSIPFRNSDHDPLLIGLDLGHPTFTLELLHTADQEAGIPALDDAPRFSAVLNALKAQDLGNDGIEDNTLVLSSGDAILPGLFFSASEDVFGGAGRADILIQNELGFSAIALGNHEFDLDTAFLAELIAGVPDDPATPEDESFIGAQFPYLSANLDFSTDANLAGLVVEDAKAALPNSLAASTVIDVNGEKIGVVGATTPTINVISSPGDVTIEPGDFDGVPTPAQLDALAAAIQTDVDALLSANPDINKVVLLAHMQQIAIEQELAKRLKNVDIIMAGGSNTRLFDESDRPRTGDSNQGLYPIIETDADGNPVAVINTDGNYKYVGRLVIDFDENGVIIPESYDPTVSGAYATDEQGVADLNAQGLVDPEIQQIVNDLRAVIEAKESNVFGVSEVYLDGTRSSVRTQETNLGNLTADANLAIAREITGDNSILVSLKNGGGIRDDIGRVVIPAGGTGDPVELPNEGIPGVKPEGGISENDIANTLRFNNGLTVLDITREGLVAALEHGVAASSLDDSNTQGRFPQISGVEFSFDLTLPGGDRIQSAAIKDADGNILDVLVRNGEFAGNATDTVRIVTLGFLAGGGDGYPFQTFGSNFQDLALADDAPRTGNATFAPDGSEQDALAEYLFDNFLTTPFNEADTERDLDTRLQNLAFREDAVLPLNNNPIATDDSFNTHEDVLLSGNVLSNDTDSDGDALFVSAIDGNAANVGTTITLTSGAELIVEANGDLTYIADRDDVTDTFTYEVGDGNGGIDTATVTIRVLDGEFREGGAGRDFLLGTSGDDTLIGQGGRDTLVGKKGDDFLFGGAGRDFLFGGKGDDFLDGGAGKDFLIGGRGEDTARYDGVLSDYTFSGAAGYFTVRGAGMGKDTLINIEFLSFAGDDTLVPTADLFV